MILSAVRTRVDECIEFARRTVAAAAGKSSAAAHDANGQTTHRVICQGSASRVTRHTKVTLPAQERAQGAGSIAPHGHAATFLDVHHATRGESGSGQRGMRLRCRHTRRLALEARPLRPSAAHYRSCGPPNLALRALAANAAITSRSTNIADSGEKHATHVFVHAS